MERKKIACGTRCSVLYGTNKIRSCFTLPGFAFVTVLDAKLHHRIHKSPLDGTRKEDDDDYDLPNRMPISRQQPTKGDGDGGDNCTTTATTFLL
jgi:hypothetical protein